jgi:hypothetical protein
VARAQLLAGDRVDRGLREALLADQIGEQVALAQRVIVPRAVEVADLGLEVHRRRARPATASGASRPSA